MLAQAVAHASPKFTNASKLFAMCSRDELQIVRVLNRTANITNGHVLLRRYVDVPDGVYDVGMDGSLSMTRYEYGMSYPDIEMIRPPFEKMQPYCTVPKDLMAALIQLCQQATQVRGDIVLNKTGAFMLQNTALNVAYPLNLPHPVTVTPKYLEIALVEMLQYPLVYLLQETRPSDSKEGPRTPIVIGVDWGSCALIMPQAKKYEDD